LAERPTCQIIVQNAARIAPSRAELGRNPKSGEIFFASSKFLARHHAATMVYFSYKLLRQRP
jgi:hypothetical protein